MRNYHLVDKQWQCLARGCETAAFVRLADLRMHVVRAHSPTRPFPCRVPSCRKKLASHSELRRHIIQVHADLVLSLRREVEGPLATNAHHHAHRAQRKAGIDVDADKDRRGGAAFFDVAGSMKMGWLGRGEHAPGAEAPCFCDDDRGPRKPWRT